MLLSYFSCNESRSEDSLTNEEKWKMMYSIACEYKDEYEYADSNMYDGTYMVSRTRSPISSCALHITDTEEFYRKNCLQGQLYDSVTNTCKGSPVLYRILKSDTANNTKDIALSPEVDPCSSDTTANKKWTAEISEYGLGLMLKYNPSIPQGQQHVIFRNSSSMVYFENNGFYELITDNPLAKIPDFAYIQCTTPDSF